MIGLLGMAVLWEYRGWLIAGFIAYCIGKTTQELYPLWHSRRAAKRMQRAVDEAERDLVRMRADYQDRQWREAHLYEGDYPAETMPLTRELWEPEDWKLPPDWSGIVKPE